MKTAIRTTFGFSKQAIQKWPSWQGGLRQRSRLVQRKPRRLSTIEPNPHPNLPDVNQLLKVLIKLIEVKANNFQGEDGQFLIHFRFFEQDIRGRVVDQQVLYKRFLAVREGQAMTYVNPSMLQITGRQKFEIPDISVLQVDMGLITFSRLINGQLDPMEAYKSQRIIVSEGEPIELMDFYDRLSKPQRVQG